MSTTARYQVATLLHGWETGSISKYDFYDATMGNTPKLISEVTGIDIDVIKDRRRYLRQLAQTF
jgi:hypothetical protein